MIFGPVATLRVAPHALLVQPALDVHRRLPENPYPIYEDILPGAEVEGWWGGRWYRMAKLTLDTWSRVEHFQVRAPYHSAWLVPRDLQIVGAQYSEEITPPYPSREWLVETGRNLLEEAEAREELREGAAKKATWYQCAGAAMSHTRPWTFLRWAPGGGKTAGATFAALSKPGDILVLCPGKARKEWRTTPGRMRSSIEKFTLLESHVILPRSDRDKDYEDIDAYLARMKERGERALVVVGMEALADYLDDLKHFFPTTLIIDEVHDLGDHSRWSALATQTGRTTFETAKTTGGEMKRSVAAMKVSRLPSIKTRIVMTGTPLDDGRPRRLWAPLDLLSPGGFGRYANYRSRYTGLTLSDAGYIDDSGTSNLQELKQRCSMFFFDVSRAETHASLPALRLEVSYLKKDELNAPDSFAAELRKLAKEAGRTDATGMEARMREREARLAEACSMKRGAVRKRAKEFLDTDGKVVVLLSRIAMAERWFEQWTKSFPEVQGWLATGHVSEKERDRIVDAYAEHPGPCFLLGTGHSIGTSKDGMQHSDLAVIAQLPEKPGLWLQWIGRFDRLGGRSPIVWAPIAEGSADDKEAARLVRKLGPLERFMDAPELREMADKIGGLDDDSLIDSILDKLLVKGIGEEE